MTNIHRTPYQNLEDQAGQSGKETNQGINREQGKPQVAEIGILRVWNEHRSLITQTRMHLL